MSAGLQIVLRQVCHVSREQVGKERCRLVDETKIRQDFGIDTRLKYSELRVK